MRGHIAKRTGKDGKPFYYIVYYIGDRKKWEAVPSPRTKKHAEKLLAERLSQIHRGEFVEPKKITFGEFKDIWLDKYARGEVRPSTLTHYTNPAEKVRYPKIPRREMDCMAPGEVRLFLEHVPAKWYAFFLTAVTTGLRIGELLAMRWANLDWNRGQYYVRESWMRPRRYRPAVFAEPKTESSIAPVDLTPACLEVLREHQRRQAEEKLRAGGGYDDQDLIFATATGGPLHDINIVTRVYKPALKAAGIRTTLRFHDLRHTCASLLIAQGESPKYVQKQLRHASIDITFDRYGHLFPGENRQAARRLDETLFGRHRNVSGTV